MTAETAILREEIEQFRRELNRDGRTPLPLQIRALLDMAAAHLDEPARLAAARDAGVREGIEMAAQWHDAQAVRYAGNRAQVDYLHREYASRIRSLSPAPAEPSAPVAPKDVPGTAAGWMETARHYAKGSEYYQSLLDQIGQMFGSAAYTSDDGSVQDSILRAKVPELVAARISALEAENEKLRERGALVVQALDGPGASAQLLVSAVDGLRALLQGQGGADA